jgi:hypothetical protein
MEFDYISFGSLVLLACCSMLVGAAKPDDAAEWAQMIRTIETQANDIVSTIGHTINPRVLEAMGRVPRSLDRLVKRRAHPDN